MNTPVDRREQQREREIATRLTNFKQQLLTNLRERESENHKLVLSTLEWIEGGMKKQSFIIPNSPPYHLSLSLSLFSLLNYFQFYIYKR